MNKDDATNSAKIIYNNYSGWLTEIQTYSNNKHQHLNSNQSYPRRITHQTIANRNNVFHPINQRYNDDAFNSNLMTNEHNKIKDTIAKNYDNMLRNEQTFNIISLKDKFAPFKHHINYPTIKSVHVKQNKETSKASYNILSNIPLYSHHYNPPEKRPICPNDTNTPQKFKSRNINIRDFNIVNNNYHQFHNEKMETEKEIEKYSAAKKLLRNQSYNLIQERYFDDNKQGEYQFTQHRRNEEAGKQRSSYSNNALLFNPVNHHVYDEDKLNEYDTRVNNRKKRFAVRESIEDYYKELNYFKDVKQEQDNNNRVSYFKFKVADERGYDILNYQNTFNQYKEGKGFTGSNSYNNNKNNMMSHWEMIQNGANDNQTFNTKPIYTSLYNSSDVDMNKQCYDNHRNVKLKNLPKIEDDPLFNKRIPYHSKLPQISNPF